MGEMFGSESRAYVFKLTRRRPSGLILDSACACYLSLLSLRHRPMTVFEKRIHYENCSPPWQHGSHKAPPKCGGACG